MLEKTPAPPALGAALGNIPVAATHSEAFRARRTYNRFVANETLEDFALRFTARRARRWSMARVANTAIGSISFLALEVIGGVLTLAYGFDNAVPAILLVGAVLFLTGLPISYHAAKSGVDIDLLTRGAGFGYIGSTVTSLIYASFTFIFFALEAAILSAALAFCFGIPLWLGFLINALVVIPLVTHGFTRIGAFQKWTQPGWALLHLIPLLALLALGPELGLWTGFEGEGGAGGFDPILMATASGVIFALMAQIGEQVDFLRFLPEPRTARERRGWWVALLVAGPGWAVLGTFKMLLGSFLAVMLLSGGTPAADAVEPTQMYLAAYSLVLPPEVALAVTGLFVILSQLKINVTNAYAGSIAWSNFFCRLTHSHPGRVVWLVFNVAIALLIMQFGVYGALEATLTLYGHIATAWIAAITADLVINKPLRLSPPGIEFRRAHLHDFNPVGIGATLLGSLGGLLAYAGMLGAGPAAYSSFIALGLPLVAAPLIALGTRGRFYLVDRPDAPRAPDPGARPGGAVIGCTICEHRFDPEDMTHCPFHAGPICSLCCALEVRCQDMCRPQATARAMGNRLADRFRADAHTRRVVARYSTLLAVFGSFTLIIGPILLLGYGQAVLTVPGGPGATDAIANSFWLVFGLLVLVAGVLAWLYTLARESRQLATEEREHQTQRLMAEIRAHKRTDAELLRAKETAEAANEAKSRYVAGMSHELRTPLNAILGYAQLLEHDPTIPTQRQPALRVIRRSSEHLADLIESLLDISKIEAGKLEIQRTDCSLRDVIEQMAATFSREAQEKALVFRLQIDPGVPEHVHADARRLRQILMNLLSNAVRYTDRGEVGFTIRFRNDIATFIVSDTGRGIAAQAQESIFEPFVRLEDPANPVPGTGLGLTISKLLVDLLGGDLQVDSAPGRGSTFTVRLMLPITRSATPQTPPRRYYGYRGPRRSVLVVDDNADHRMLIEDALRPLGFDLVFAESGKAALAAVRAQAPDLALVDVSMPGMDGWTLVARLRRDLGLAAPIMMLSALTVEQQARDPAAPGHHDDFLAKPLDIEVLLRRMELHLRLDWIRDEAGPPPIAPFASVVPEENLAALAQALGIGHVRGVARALDELERARPEAADFVAAARRLLDRLDLAGLERLVREGRP